MSDGPGARLERVTQDMTNADDELPGERERGARKNFHGRTNDAFCCFGCGLEVRPLANGSFRNHCPRCLASRHVDVVPGDRASPCGGLMPAISVFGSSAGVWKITHRCERCGHERANLAALDDPEQPDDFDTLMEI